ncbi:MAG: hypothetical protein ACFFEF_08455, partial [Candidatus Thorarchaeota archaeon]
RSHFCKLQCPPLACPPVPRLYKYQGIAIISQTIDSDTLAQIEAMNGASSQVVDFGFWFRENDDEWAKAEIWAYSSSSWVLIANTVWTPGKDNDWVRVSCMATYTDSYNGLKVRILVDDFGEDGSYLTIAYVDDALLQVVTSKMSSPTYGTCAMTIMIQKVHTEKESRREVDLSIGIAAESNSGYFVQKLRITVQLGPTDNWGTTQDGWSKVEGYGSGNNVEIAKFPLEADPEKISSLALYAGEAAMSAGVEVGVVAFGLASGLPAGVGFAIGVIAGVAVNYLFNYLEELNMNRDNYASGGSDYYTQNTWDYTASRWLYPPVVPSTAEATHEVSWRYAEGTQQVYLKISCAVTWARISFSPTPPFGGIYYTETVGTTTLTDYLYVQGRIL